MPLTEAAIGAIASGIATLGSSAFNAASQARVNAQNREQAERALQAQRDAIARMNEYNSPSQQVLRMKAAGLNPALAYGADGSMVGNQSDIPEYSPIPSEAPQVGNLGLAGLEAARYGLEVREQKNRDDLAVAEVAVKSAQSYMYTTSGDLTKGQLNEINTLLGFKTQAYLDEHALSQARFDEIQQQIRESESRIGLNEVQIAELNSLINLHDVEASEILALLPHKIRNMDAQTLMYNAQAGLLSAEVERVAEEVATLQYNRAADQRNYNLEVQRYNREGRQYNNSLQMWQAEKRLQIEEGHAQRVSDIFRVLLGGSMLVAGQSLKVFTTPSEPARTAVTGFGGQ